METLSKLASHDYVAQYLIPWGINIVTALAIFFIGRWAARLLVEGLNRVMKKAHVEDTLRRFLVNILNAVLLVVIVIAALNRLGVDTTSVLAVFAAAGLAVGLALKDSLSNFAAGVLLIVFKPFKVEDLVEAGGATGVVERITILHTVLRTPDNREVIMPNSKIYADTIINYSARDTRRIDLVIGISYDDDIAKAKHVIAQVLAEEKRVLRDPEPVILVGELADSSINLYVRPWVKTDDFWTVRSDIVQRIKERFDANGITIPFPQLDVHTREPARARATV